MERVIGNTDGREQADQQEVIELPSDLLAQVGGGAHTMPITLPVLPPT
jgi:hypothetical protein